MAVHTIRRAGASIAACFFVAGCVAHRQTQYFEVVDPDSGNINYYRMTLEGGGGIGVNYQLQAGYFSAASVDVLRGRIPQIPEVDLPIECDAAFEALTAGYYDSLVTLSEATRQNRGADLPAGIDDLALQNARLVWFGQLSPADVAAMGMNQSNNPFEFRKLVFWSSAQNIDLRAYGSEIDAMIDSATTLIRASRMREKRDASQRRSVSEFIIRLLETQPELAPFKDAVTSLLGPPHEQ
ncbi:MAG: hypothetical protein KF841_15720 [Phycisphaerae bacterium]|nr:hypothetical protein [Phycisphaerae bacterium]